MKRPEICPGAGVAVHALAAAAIALPGLAVSQDLPPLPAPLAVKVEDARQTCADFENGTIVLDWGAVERVDLDGDIVPDWVLNEAGFACSSAASLFCGTGGCMSHFLVGEALRSVLNQGWQAVTVGPMRVLITDVHGSQCGGINPTPCATASIWDAEAQEWRSAAATWE